MLGVFAQFETALRRERQMEGIAKAKKAGVYKGRPATISFDEIRRLKAEGMRSTDIARQLKIGRGSVSRYEQGERRLDLIEFADVCRALGLDPPKYFWTLFSP